MTVGELKEHLENYDDEMVVYFGYDYGDHWRTQVRKEISTVTEENLIHSSYHQMMKEADDDDDDDETVEGVVLT